MGGITASKFFLAILATSFYTTIQREELVFYLMEGLLMWLNKRVTCKRSYLFLFGVISLMVSFIACDSISNQSPKQIFPEKGRSPLPGVEELSYKTKRTTINHKPKLADQNNYRIQWEKIKPLLRHTQDQTSCKYAAFYSLHDSRQGFYYYRATKLSFSPEAIKQAEGDVLPFLLESARTPASPTELFIASIPASKKAIQELTAWIASKKNLRQAEPDNPEAVQILNAKANDNGIKHVYVYPDGAAPCGYELVDVIYADAGAPGDYESITYVYKAATCPDSPFGGGSGSGGGSGPGGGETGGGGPNDHPREDVPCNQQLVPGKECSNTCNDSQPPYNPCKNEPDGPTPQPVEPEPCETSATEIEAAFPEASQAVADKVSSMISKYGEKFDIDTKYELQHFLAQAAHESGGFTDLSVTENMNYSAQRLLEIFGYLFSQIDPSKADPDDYAGKPEKIGNFVYKYLNGNGGVASGDGYRYRGRGIFQLSQWNNYEAFTNFAQNELGMTTDFVANPGLVASNRETAILSAMWFYKENVLDVMSVDENTTVEEVTKMVNGQKMNGLADRKEKFNDAKVKIDDCNK